MEPIDSIIEQIVSVYIAIFWTSIVVGNIIRLIVFIKCFKVKNCTNDNCPICTYCRKYHCIMTEEYKEELIWLFLEGKEEDFFKNGNNLWCEM